MITDGTCCVQVVAEATSALEWLEEKQKLQNSLRATDDPVLLASEIAKREGTLVRFTNPILNKPAPPPPKVATLRLLKSRPDLLLHGLES